MKQHLNEQEPNDMLNIQYAYEKYLGLNSGLWAKCSECVNTTHSSVAIVAEAPVFPPPPEPCLSVPCVCFSPQTNWSGPASET